MTVRIRGTYIHIVYHIYTQSMVWLSCQDKLVDHVRGLNPGEQARWPTFINQCWSCSSDMYQMNCGRRGLPGLHVLRVC